jgi:hypothetical protein
MSQPLQLYAHILLGSLNPLIFVTHSEANRSLGLLYDLKVTTRMISLARRTRPVPSIADKHRSVTRKVRVLYKKITREALIGVSVYQSRMVSGVRVQPVPVSRVV